MAGDRKRFDLSGGSSTVRRERSENVASQKPPQLLLGVQRKAASCIGLLAERCDPARRCELLAFCQPSRFASASMTDINKFIALRNSLQQERALLEARLAEITRVLGQTPPVSAPTTTTSAAEPSDTTPKKRTLSAATKAKMAASHQARWAAKRAKASGVTAPVAKAEEAPEKRNKMSAKGLANIVAAQKARWAAKNAAKSAPAAAPKQAKRIISPEAKARMIAGAKKRWAKAGKKG